MFRRLSRGIFLSSRNYAKLPKTNAIKSLLVPPHVAYHHLSKAPTQSSIQSIFRSYSSIDSATTTNQPKSEPPPPPPSVLASGPPAEEEESWCEIGDLEEAKPVDAFEGISMERGKTGVFDVEDLVAILQREKVG